MHAFRAAIQRHIASPPFNRTISIISDAEFKPANLVFTGRLKLNRAQGNDKTKHKDAIESGDLAKMYSTETLSNKNPQALQYKVFFEISLHFARRAKEGLRDLRKSSFEIKSDHDGTRYATIAYNEKSKKDHGEFKDFVEKEQRLYEQPQESSCPLKSLELYLSKLHPNNDDFFQQPRASIKDEIWYNGRPVGTGTLAQFMSRISKEADLSRNYTNHCIRATAITILSTAGVDGTDIISVSGHKTIQSLIPYKRKVGDEKRKSMSNILARYGKQERSLVPTATATHTGSMESTGQKSPSAANSIQIASQALATHDHNQLQGLIQGNTFHGAQQFYFNVHVNK